MADKERAFILGLGKSGQSAARFLLQRGFHVLASDDRFQSKRDAEGSPAIANLQDLGLELLADSAANLATRLASVPFKESDFFVVSPGVPPSHPLYVLAKQKKWRLIGEAELALSFFKGQKVLAVTGTNGKTTVTSLAEHLLNASGIPAIALGNIGRPLTSIDLLEHQVEHQVVIVAELSSYQLETMRGPYFDGAVLLNITPDHLDRYPDFTAYMQAKVQLFSCLKADGRAAIARSALEQFGAHLPKRSYDTYEVEAVEGLEKCALFLKEGFLHDQRQAYPLPALYRQPSIDSDNLLAALSLTLPLGIEVKSAIESLSSFQKPPHRLEWVGVREGVTYVNDSKGTNLDAALKAVKAMPGRVILIAGGVHKGFSYQPWVLGFGGKVAHIVAVGQAAPLIAADVGASMPVTVSSSFDQAVRLAAELAVPGDTVLLSPGCASLDLFQSYAERGDAFKAIVNSLRK
ncbi:MAG: UDP-N-acetylmuramoylalanine--D-glutamate ligase [Chlamydiales bacterium]|jgi:UDP-N-acetylmuramoylalanine--D-glutamate ligase|nr:UDP-N-acetylmuramoylalanine--D-glutamate ligase [Chlamydiales bacterium]